MAKACGLIGIITLAEFAVRTGAQAEGQSHAIPRRVRAEQQASGSGDAGEAGQGQQTRIYR